MYRIDTGAAIDQAAAHSVLLLVVFSTFIVVVDPEHFSLLLSPTVNQSNIGVNKDTVLASTVPIFMVTAVLDTVPF